MTPRVFIAPMFAAIFFIFAYIVVKGRGDKFIAGYNTASKEEKAQVNVKRAPGAMVVLLSFGLAFIVLANTWAKKK